MGASSPAGAAIFQVKITLKGVSKPPVWRRVLVPSGIRLSRFHDVIQAVMGWSDYHMHVFSTDGGEYGVADPELGHHDERRVPLRRVLDRPGDRLTYTYDFGDDWDHEIVIEEALSADPDALYPRCSAVKGACPPEVWGYMNLREVLANPNADEHDGDARVVGLDSGSEFDPAAFDLAAVNESLAYAVAAH